jgi:hypothetical protein
MTSNENHNHNQNQTLVKYRQQYNDWCSTLEHDYFLYENPRENELMFCYVKYKGIACSIKMNNNEQGCIYTNTKVCYEFNEYKYIKNFEKCMNIIKTANHKYKMLYTILFPNEPFTLNNISVRGVLTIPTKYRNQQHITKQIRSILDSKHPDELQKLVFVAERVIAKENTMLIRRFQSYCNDGKNHMLNSYASMLFDHTLVCVNQTYPYGKIEYSWTIPFSSVQAHTPYTYVKCKEINTIRDLIQRLYTMLPNQTHSEEDAERMHPYEIKCIYCMPSTNFTQLNNKFPVMKYRVKKNTRILF